MNVARHSGMSQPLYMAVKGRREELAIPDNIFQELKNGYTITAITNLAKLQELDRISGELAAKNIKTILLKGAHLLHTVFSNDLGARSMDDIDLLVRQEETVEASGVLESLGYLYLKAGDGERPTRMYIKNEGAITHAIHLHSHIVNVSNRYLDLVKASIDIDEIWSLATNDMMRDDHMLISLCEHAFRHGFARLGMLYDIHSFTGYLAGSIDWDELKRTSIRWSMETPVYYGLYLAKAFFGTEVQDGIFKALRPGGLSFFERRVIERVARKDYPDEREYFLFSIFQQRTLQGKLRFLKGCALARFGVK